jgi:hypothetical protein
MPVCDRWIITAVLPSKFFVEKESEAILRPYWPIGANGSILIISRQYYNFMKDVNRKGESIKPLNEQESLDLLVRLIGDKWTEAAKSGQLKEADLQAARDWVDKLGGLRKYFWQHVCLILTSHFRLSNKDSCEFDHESKNHTVLQYRRKFCPFPTERAKSLPTIPR